MKLVVEEKLQPGHPYVLSVHPHGIIGLSVWGLLVGQKEQSIERLGGIDFRVATVSHHFLVPFWRDFLMACGFGG